MNSHGCPPVEPVVTPNRHHTPPAGGGKLDALERWLGSAGPFVLTGGLYLVGFVSGSKLEAWLVTPQTWLGLHPIASWALDIPLWLGLLFAGLFSTWLAILFGEN